MNQIVRLALLAVPIVLLFSACGETPATEETTDAVVADSAATDGAATNNAATNSAVTEVTETEYLFDFYTVPADWPRAVPIMSDFKVTEYSRTETEMHAAGYGNTDMSWANNYYTNARQEFVSSNIWAFDPANTSVTEGDQQVFYYVGEGHSLVINLNQTAPGRVEFTLDFTE